MLLLAILTLIHYQNINGMRLMLDQASMPPEALLIPALDGNGMDVIYEKTSHMGVKQMTGLIEWNYAFGSGPDAVPEKDFNGAPSGRTSE